jgi:hypothetical protein
VVSIWPASQPFIRSLDWRCLCWQHRLESPFTSGSDLSSHSAFALVGRTQLFASVFDRLPVAGQLCGRRAISDVCVCDPDTTADVRCWRPTSISPFPPVRLYSSTTSSPVASALPALPSALRSLALATPIRVTPGSPGSCTAALSVLSCLFFRPGRRVPSVYNSSWIANMFKHDSDASQLVKHPYTMSGSAVGDHRIENKLVGYTTHRQ